MRHTGASGLGAGDGLPSKSDRTWCDMDAKGRGSSMGRPGNVSGSDLGAWPICQARHGRHIPWLQIQAAWKRLWKRLRSFFEGPSKKGCDMDTIKPGSILASPRSVSRSFQRRVVRG